MTDNVLVPHDLTEFSDAALDLLPRLGRIGRVHVVHVLPRLETAHPDLLWPVEEDEPRRRNARNALEIRLRGTAYEHAQLHVAIGDPASRIVELARQLGTNLVVMPTHGRTGAERLLLGSVAEHVVRFAPCPVLVIPAAAADVWSQDRSPTPPEGTREDQVEQIAILILDQVRANPEQFLTAARIAVPEGEEPGWWEERLSRRLLASGIEFVDLVFAPHPGPWRILDLRFEDRFA